MPDYTTMTDTERARAMIELHRKIGDVNTRLAELKAQRAELEALVLEDFIETGASSRPFNDATVARRLDLYASAQPGADLQLFRAYGLEHTITTNCNAQKLKSWVISERNARGLKSVFDADGNLLLDLPPALEAAIKITEKPSVRVT